MPTVKVWATVGALHFTPAKWEGTALPWGYPTEKQFEMHSIDKLLRLEVEVALRM